MNENELFMDWQTKYFQELAALYELDSDYKDNAAALLAKYIKERDIYIQDCALQGEIRNE